MIHKEVSNNNALSDTRLQKLYNMPNNVLSHKLDIGDFVMINPPTRRPHKLQHRWISPLGITGAKSTNIFEVENLQKTGIEVFQVQRMVPHQVSRNIDELSESLKEQSIRLSSTYHLVQ